MKILVTGATGFIGSHLVELLVAEGENVRCFTKPGSDISSIANLTNDIGYGDLIDIEAIKEATKGIDVVYHLGAFRGFLSHSDSNLLGRKDDCLLFALNH